MAVARAAGLTLLLITGAGMWALSARLGPDHPAHPPGLGLQSAAVGENRRLLPVFTDALEADWQFSDWNNTAYLVVFHGSGRRIQVRYTEPWAGFTVDHRNQRGETIEFAADAFDHLVFDIEGDESSLAAVSVYLDNGSAPQPVNAWRVGARVRIPLSVLNDARAPIARIVFFNGAARGAPSITLDNIAFELTQDPPLPRTAPSPRPLRIEIDPGRSFPVSPYVYGDNSLRNHQRIRFARLGGNRWSAYNYTNNASNSGVDWGPHSNDGYLSLSTNPAAPVQEFVRAAARVGAVALITVPMLDWVAADKDGLVADPAGPGNRRFVSSSVSGATAVRQELFVRLVEEARGEATVWWSLDNEPALWPSSHPLVHSGPTTYREMSERSVAYARMIKAVAPRSLVFFGVCYGYAEFADLQGAPDAGGRAYLDFLLDEMRGAGERSGQRLGDVLDVHWYPETRTAQGRVAESQRANPSPEEVEARVQAPRSLWDPGYVEKTWITKVTGGPVRLLPWLREKLSRHYPGTKLAVTEYNYGGGEHISGAIAQADVLGILGREQVFAASLWAENLQESDSFVVRAFDMFLDFDGRGGRVGDTGLFVAVEDVALASAYAFQDRGGHLQVVVLNKSGTPLETTLSVDGLTAGRRFAAHTLQGAARWPLAGEVLVSKQGVFRATLPPLSIVTFAEVGSGPSAAVARERGLSEATAEGLGVSGS